MIKFTGSTRDCVGHFTSDHGLGNTDRSSLIKYRRIREALGTDYKTLYRWFRNLNMPGGILLSRLRLFLSVAGYQPKEWESFDHRVVDLANCLALGVIKVEEIAPRLGITVDSVRRIIYGTSRGLFQDRLSAIAALVSELKPAYELKFAPWSEGIVRTFNAKIPDPAVRRIESETDGINCKAGVLVSLSQMIKAVEVLAEQVLSGTYSLEDREHLRSLCRNGCDSHLFDCSNALSRLCGETARNKIRGLRKR